jgi:hypothetical protein
MTSTSKQLPTANGDTPLRASRRQTGLYISIVGIAALVPLMLCAIFVEQSRGLFALSALLAWVVWKVGRTIMKLNSPAELH